MRSRPCLHRLRYGEQHHMTELMWEGKYDKDGRKIAPPRIALPFQAVETVNESAADRDRTQDLFAAGRPTDWRNRLIWGDKKYVLPSLLQEFTGKIKLVYIDPPFATGGDFSFTANVPDDPEGGDESRGVSFVKQPSVIEQKAYRDTWGKGLDSYVRWLYETLTVIRELLSPEGNLFLHLGVNVAAYARPILDEVMGPDNYTNEIIWKRSAAHSDIGQGAAHLGRLHDVIYWYRASEASTANMQYEPYSEDYVRSAYKHVEATTGRRYRIDNTSGPGGARKGNPFYEFRGVKKYWRYSEETIARLFKEGRLVQTSTGGDWGYKRYLDEMPGVPIQDLWTDIPPLQSQSSERTGYETQKPEKLLERIILLGSNPSDLVLDCFVGSGTTAAVAERLNRRWVACDLGRFAIHTTRKRLLGIPGVMPFVVENLGKYERQAWQAAEFGASAESTARSYRRFVLALYQAEEVQGYIWLHGSKGGRMVHVGSVDAPVTRADVTALLAEFRKAIGKGKGTPRRSGVDVLGWDFAFELHETARQEAELAGIDLRLVRIPREVLEPRAVEQGDIKFFELAALSVKVKQKGRAITLELVDFMIPLDDVPEDIRKAVTHWEQWIDYWAIDWNNSDDTFHNEWQAYRTRADSSLTRQTTHTYPQPGTYRVVIKVIDILGNDTTKMIEVEVQ